MARRDSNPHAADVDMSPEAVVARARTKKKFLIAASLFAIGLAICVALMITSIQRFNKENPRRLFATKRVYEREFTYAGKPVKFTDIFPAGTPATHKDGRPSFNSPQTPADALEIAFGEGDSAQRVRVPVHVPSTVTLPDLLAHNDYLRVLRMVETTGRDMRETLAKMEKGEVPDRLIIVARIPPALPTQQELETWGKVWKKRWAFDIWELLPDGTIHQERRLRYPTGGPFRQAKEGELQDNTWQFAAALTTMPQEGGIGPTVKLFNNALRAASLALPGAMFCGLGLSLCLAFAFAPGKRVR
jgi:hypothetical protein